MSRNEAEGAVSVFPLYQVLWVILMENKSNTTGATCEVGIAYSCFLWPFVCLSIYRFRLTLWSNQSFLAYDDNRHSMHIIATGLYASNFLNHIGGVMVSVFASEWYIVGSSPDRVKPKTIIGICCFSAHNAASRSKSKNWFLRNQDNVSAWSGMSFHSLLFQWASTMHFQLSVLI
jgi:hypothetical protein